MITYRQRGLNTLHALLCTSAALALLVIWTQWVAADPTTSPAAVMPYALVVTLGMLLGFSYFRSKLEGVSSLSWKGLLALSSRQVALVSALVLALALALQDERLPWTFWGSYFFVLGMGLLTLHWVQPRVLSRLVFPDRALVPTVLLGSTEKLDSWVERNAGIGLRLVGYVSETAGRGTAMGAVPHLGTVDELESILRAKRVQQVVLTEWANDAERIERLIRVCQSEGVRLMIHNDYSTRYARNFIPVVQNEQHFLALQEEPLEDPWNRLMKRGLDIAVSLPVVVLVLPVLLAVTAIIQSWQSPGPVMHVRNRGGRYRLPFAMFKLRTMHVAPQHEAVQATQGDSRVYPWGRFLRRSSLDEIPQFLNVLRGEMSVVGPRPHLPQHDDEFSQIARDYRIRSLVKPGITGLAQTRGFRGEITEPELLKKRVYWDLYYGANWSLRTDLAIIFRTAWQVVRPPKTAY